MVQRGKGDLCRRLSLPCSVTIYMCIFFLQQRKEDSRLIFVNSGNPNREIALLQIVELHSA